MLPTAKAKLLRQLQSRHGRRKADVFLVEGLRCCTEALRHRPEAIDFWLLAEGTEPPWSSPPAAELSHLPAATFAELAQTESPQGILCVMRQPSAAPPATCPDPFVLVLDRVQTPGNLGSILRSAVAIGLRTIACTAGTVDPWSPKSMRAGMGAQFLLDIASFDTLASLRAHYRGLGFQRLWITDVNAGTSCFDPAFDLAGSLLVMGNEAHGTEPIAGASTVHIPMSPRMESLNVAQAATLLIYNYTARHGLIQSSGSP